MLGAARRIGEGKFDERVPVHGDDEMAGLAVEFNRMSERLDRQMGQLKHQRRELDLSVRRLGDAFASGLDRDGLLGIVLDTALAACGAEGGRVVIHHRPGQPGELASEGSSPELAAVLAEAGEAAAVGRGAASAQSGELYSIAHAMVDGRERERLLCTLAVGRSGRPLSEDEREVLSYLIGQTAVSIENIDLHERFAEQAVTDELTGISNYRHFSEWIDSEVARVKRFGGEVSLLLVDLDDFKAVNDAHGHQQGDRVLEEVGLLLRAESRGIDESARYGGEEFVLGLPETGAEGAQLVAERLRTRIEEAAVQAVGGGVPVGVTASIGLATLPADAHDAQSLIAAADAALYQAKRDGKNRVAAAADTVVAPQGNPGVRRS